MATQPETFSPPNSIFIPDGQKIHGVVRGLRLPRPRARNQCRHSRCYRYDRTWRLVRLRRRHAIEGHAPGRPARERRAITAVRCVTE